MKTVYGVLTATEVLIFCLSEFLKAVFQVPHLELSTKLETKESERLFCTCTGSLSEIKVALL